MPKPRGFSSELGLSFDRGSYRYTLAPYVWDTTLPDRPRWRLPSPIGGIDLRPLAAQAISGGTPQGMGFCASLSPVTGVVIATVPHMAEAVSSTAMRDAWEAANGFRPQGAKLVDLLWDQLTVGSDPTGAAGPKPLMPGTDGQLKLYVGGHSLVKAERFRFGVHPHTGRVRDVMQRDFRDLWEQTNGDDHCRRVLDFHCKKYRCPDWREFVPTNLRSHLSGPLPHETTINESFNKADSTTLGPDLTWVELYGDLEVFSNSYREVTGADNGEAYADSALSSDDHYSQVTIAVVPMAGWIGPLARVSTSARTFYATLVSETSWGTFKRVAGTYTDIGTPTSVSTATNDTVKIEPDGSTITRYRNGVSQDAVSDSAITGNLYCGIASGVQGGRGDAFVAADLAAGGATYSDLVNGGLVNCGLVNGGLVA